MSKCLKTLKFLIADKKSAFNFGGKDTKIPMLKHVASFMYIAKFFI